MVRSDFFMETLQQQENWLRLRHEVSEKRVAMAFRVLEGHGLCVLLIKGYAASLNYPKPWSRPFSDIDLCIAPEHYSIAKELISSTELAFGIDLHLGFRHLHPGSFEKVFKRGVSVDLDGVQIHIPSAEDHLVLLTTHWLNDGGAKRERLQDLRYLIEANPQLDWGYLIGALPAHRLRWVGIALGLTIMFSGLDRLLVKLPAEAMSVPGWVVDAVEKEWSSTPISPLYDTGIEAKTFIAQLRRRIPPNPLEAVVECDGDFDSRLVPWYQMVSLFKRIPKGLQMQTQRWRASRGKE